MHPSVGALGFHFPRGGQDKKSAARKRRPEEGETRTRSHSFCPGWGRGPEPLGSTVSARTGAHSLRGGAAGPPVSGLRAGPQAPGCWPRSQDRSRARAPAHRSAQGLTGSPELHGSHGRSHAGVKGHEESSTPPSRASPPAPGGVAREEPLRARADQRKGHAPCSLRPLYHVTSGARSCPPRPLAHVSCPAILERRARSCALLEAAGWTGPGSR